MFKRFFFSLISLILIYLIVNFSRQAWKLWRSGRLVEEKQRQLNVVEEKNRQLRAELEKVQGAEYIETEAREKLGMGKVGEKVIIMPQMSTNLGSTNLGNTNKQISNEPNWEKWWQLFIY